MFEAWLAGQCAHGRRIYPRDECELDDALADWTAAHMTNGKQRGQLKNCRNARLYIIKWDPSMSLKYALTVMNGWDKRVPAKPTIPMPKGLMLLMVEWFLVMNDLEMATIVSLSFELMLRTQSELLGIHVNDIRLPGTARSWTGSNFGTMHLRDTKTHDHDSVTLRPGLSTSLLKRWVMLQRQRGTQGKLFTFGATTYRRRFLRCLKALGLPDDHPYSPYSLRHGGATHLHMTGTPIAEIASRGRWRRHNTCERYVSSGRALLGSANLPESLKGLARKLLDDPYQLIRRYFSA